MQPWKIQTLTHWEDAPEARFGYKGASKTILHSLIRLSKMAGRGAALIPLVGPVRGEERGIE